MPRSLLRGLLAGDRGAAGISPVDSSAGDLPPARGPVPTLADPFPEQDPLPGAYELHLPSDGLTIWYVVAPYRGQEIISIQLVRLDT